MTQQEQLTQSFANLLEQRQFSKIRAVYPGSPYSPPHPVLGQTPNLTAHDDKDRFYLIAIVLEDFEENIDAQKKVISFGKYAKAHKSLFWLITAKAHEQANRRILEKLGIVPALLKVL